MGYNEAMHKLIALALFTALIAGTAYSGELKQIELTDGSVITGEVLSLANGIYTIRTASLGTVTVRDDRVRTIRSRGRAVPTTPSPSTAPSSSDISSLEEEMMNDGEVMDMIQSLKNDPSFQKALEDPEIMKAVVSGDTAALLANPKFLEIMNNATVRDIQQKMQK
jgi:hypothetical protein